MLDADPTPGFPLLDVLSPIIDEDVGDTLGYGIVLLLIAEKDMAL
jgi:hypothetical protein